MDLDADEVNSPVVDPMPAVDRRHECEDGCFNRPKRWSTTRSGKYMRPGGTPMFVVRCSECDKFIGYAFERPK